MRHSRSIPEHASSGGSMPRKTYKNPYDSGVSSDEYKPKDSLKQQMYVFRPRVEFIDRMKTMQNNKYVFSILRCSNRGTPQQLLNQTRKVLEDFSRSRQKKIPQSISQMPTGHHTNSLPRVREPDDGCVFTVYQFCDEEVPYRTRLPSKEPTLKMFKDALHKKGNFRYDFFFSFSFQNRCK